MRWYPFDTQICTMELFQNEETINANPVMVNYSGPVELTQHRVKKVAICSIIIKGKTGVIVEVTLGRPLFGAILTVLCQQVFLFCSARWLECFTETIWTWSLASTSHFSWFLPPCKFVCSHLLIYF